MSTITTDVDRRARIIALSTVTAISAMLVMLALALGGSFSSPGTAGQATGGKTPADVRR